jgi:hypothetical protein
MTKSDLIEAIKDMDDSAELFIFDENSSNKRSKIEDIECTVKKNSGEQKIIFCFRKGLWDD